MNAFAQRLAAGHCVVLDGGLGTMLMASGLARGAPPEPWNAERPDAVIAVHRAYVEAGSEAAHTNTFGAHPIRLAHFGVASRCEELCGAAVRNARASGVRFVIGDLGPTGEFLAPVGRGDVERWREGFRRQAAALLAAGVDALHVETMSDLREARAAVEAARQEAGGIPVLASLTFERKKRGIRTLMGDPLVGALAALREAGADFVGSNCSLASADMAALGQELVAAGGVGPIVLQPNAGQPELTPDGLRYAQEPEAFAADMAPLAATSAALGGCCGTDPRFIAALAARIAG